MAQAASLDDAITERKRLEQTWAVPRGIIGWLSAADHKSIGQRFIVTTFVFFLLGGILALLMRVQLARPENDLINPDLYNQLFSLHGTTMMFLFAVPVMEAMALYLVPLMVGTREIAFPRLAAFNYWVLLFGGLMVYVGLVLNIAPEAGWFSYVPLAGPEYSPGKRVDFWAQMVTFTELSALGISVQLIVTILKQRAPGMSLNRMPLFVWAMLVTAFMTVFAMPAVMLASSFLLMDRLIGTHFFNPAEGGDALLWQHLFWFFGHPEVYIIFLPGLGFVSSIVATFARRPVFGYSAIVLALIAIGFLSFGLWVHHMFTTGLPMLGASFFTAASMLIAIPSGLQIFCWIATLWDGRPRFCTPLLFVLGFFFIFVLGGLTGVMLASVPLDAQVHDTYFVVAHFHYVLIGGAVFPLFGAFYYWFPKATGRMLDERAGRWNFWLFFIGFNLTFFPMHQLGLIGMPRRVYTYPDGMGWNELNLLATVGAALIAASVALFIANVLWSRHNGGIAGDNPWGAGTLEWATGSPPPPWNFQHIPVVSSREPLWQEPVPARVVTGLRSDIRQLLVTGALDGDLDHRSDSPSPSIWPLLAALATAGLFVGSIFTPWAVPIGALPLAVTLIGWFWPKPGEEEEEIVSAPPERLDVSGLPEYAFGHRSRLWWGTAGFIAIEGMAFALALFAYFYLRSKLPDWPPGAAPPDLLWGTLNTLVLLASAVPNQWTKKAAEEQQLGRVRLWLVVCLAFGAVFLIIRGFEFTALNIAWDTNAYGSLVWVIMGLHTVHLLTDWVDTGVLTALMFTRHGRDRRFVDVSENAFYWYFVVVVWLPLYVVIYWVPRMG